MGNRVNEEFRQREDAYETPAKGNGMDRNGILQGESSGVKNVLVHCNEGQLV